MRYRREIDGLRAIAVLPVILFHAGFQTFSGGFIGVDVFFVISGYLITTIIHAELESDKFSIINFYERRARRILPALFLVMGVSSIFAYAWMMPDEFKNFGQSVLATTIFSNNILLAITSGYWDIASEFKPLLHTWSLGVEEQYYVIFPFFLIIAWKYFRKNLIIILVIFLVISLLLANWGLASKPNITYYILPTRLWEILLGALAAFYLSNSHIDLGNKIRNQIFSCFGFLLILSSIFLFTQNNLLPCLYTLIPTLGALLIILYAIEGTFVNALLSNRSMVGIGLISYSFYLWHQPLFAFSRIYLINPPSLVLSSFLIFLSLILSYLTWRFIEKPFRNNAVVSRKSIFLFSAIISLAFILFGYYLNKSYGIASRVFDPSIKIQDVDKRVYNEKIFTLKRDNFTFPEKLKILVVGNSFARDFVNMTFETFNMKIIDIVYRDDLSDCIFPFKSPIAENLYGSANVVVFASRFKKACVNADIAFAHNRGKRIFYIGTKHFGYNLNWLIRLDSNNRPNQYNPLLSDTIKKEREMSNSVPAENFISLLSPIMKDGQVPITDSMGRMISTDRMHLTKYGAIFFGENVLLKSPYGDFLINK